MGISPYFLMHRDAAAHQHTDSSACLPHGFEALGEEGRHRSTSMSLWVCFPRSDWGWPVLLALKVSDVAREQSPSCPQGSLTSPPLQGAAPAPHPAQAALSLAGSARFYICLPHFAPLLWCQTHHSVKIN